MVCPFHQLDYLCSQSIFTTFIDSAVTVRITRAPIVWLAVPHVQAGFQASNTRYAIDAAGGLWMEWREGVIDDGGI